jgi:outer membrane protein assembly factor BamD
MILRAKYQLAQQSVEEKRLERYRDTIDEYYGFMNEYPESKYLKDAQRIFAQSEKYVNKKS